ncbi:hypothetical protein J2752_000103 [Halarchaeum rubridurum]|uniref:Uncharacterized protein n=1 Tax=Halarchaeum rubridurum TaxID=489911 RepID=A0A830FZH1_9EURY|nr:hypothetical protein [Halarchaeum rubridurum]MBP1953222.1 hypothetical protein [Halarchaeum rubridurum]GGM66934.1 hypothetical protein GCM10009017_16330 [Halarchaeum rubridurum]
MGPWFRLYAKRYTDHYAVLGLAGVAATVALAEPGVHVVAVGPLRVDAFYSSLVCFGLLFVLSATDRYDPADYGLDSESDE